jgi:hypothetical protein
LAALNCRDDGGGKVTRCEGNAKCLGDEDVGIKIVTLVEVLEKNEGFEVLSLEDHAVSP